MRLDKEYSERRRDVPLLTERPSHYLQRMFFATQPIEEPEHLADMATLMGLFDGENNVVFASDWPHHDFDHPDKVLQIPLSDEAQGQDHGAERGAAARPARCPSGEPRRSTPIGPADAIPPGSHRVVEVNGRQIGVFNIDGEFYALPNACFHQNGPLCRGMLSGTAGGRRRQRLRARVAARRRGRRSARGTRSSST